MTGLTGAGYPAARRLDLAENINGHVVADPYRWLEDTGSAETRAWLAAQNTLAGEQLAALPGSASFYYVRRLAPDAVPPGEQQYHRRVYLHTVGTPVSADTLIFGDGRDKTDY